MLTTLLSITVGHRARRRRRRGRATPTRCGAASAWRCRRPGSTRARPGASCSSCRRGCSASRRATRRRAREELLALVELEDAADRRIKGYSGGMKRRLDLASALVHEPEVAVPRRADDRARPGEPADGLGRGAAHQRARHDRVPHHAVPRGGRPALRPAGDHRRRPDRARGHAGRSSRPSCASGAASTSDPTLDDVFLDATGRTREPRRRRRAGGDGMSQAWVLGQRALREALADARGAAADAVHPAVLPGRQRRPGRRRSSRPRPRRSSTARATARSSCRARCCSPPRSGRRRCSSSRTSRAATSTSCARRRSRARRSCWAA